MLRADLARDPSFYLRFRREAQNAAALNHPAIVAVYDTGEAETPTGPLPYIVMEYVDGVTLRDIVHTEGPMPSQRAIEVIADACQALNFSHQHGIIHRDVKPANIMISKTGAVKVMDFGIARALADANSVTQTAAVIGTAQYLSPEQARGEKVDARSDVYSLGCVLYEILTGEPPFVGDSPVAVAYQHVREDPVPPSQRHNDISPELDAVVLKALAKNPDNRYQTAAEMRADLVRVHSGEAPDAPKVLTDAERTSLHVGPPSHRTGPNRSTTRRASSPRTPSGSGAHRWAAGSSRSRCSRCSPWWSPSRSTCSAATPATCRCPTSPARRPNDAIATLQNLGFKTTSRNEPDSEVPPDHVIKHRSRGHRLGRRGRRNHHLRLHRAPSSARSRTSGPGPSSKPSSSSRTPASRTSGRPQPVEARGKGHGATNQPAGQSDDGDHQRDHDHRGLRARQQGAARLRESDRR